MKTLKFALKYLFALLFIAADVLHFVNTSFYVSIMPPYLPWPRELVYLSGVFEVLLGVCLVIPKLQVSAAWGLIALLLAVFPANIHMALHTADYPQFSSIMIWLRLPVQGVLIAWAYWYTRR